MYFEPFQRLIENCCFSGILASTGVEDSFGTSLWKHCKSHQPPAPHGVKTSLVHKARPLALPDG